MRINMPWGLIIVVASILVVGCRLDTAEDDLYGAGYIIVNEHIWSENYMTPYPFTVSKGEISCVSNPGFSRVVYFEAERYTDESYIGTPLNKSAVDALNQANMSANVLYSIKENADLSDAVQIGLKVCDEYKDYLKNP